MERDDTFNRVTLNNHDGDVYVETTGEYSEIVLKTQKVRVDGDVYCYDGDEGISARIRWCGHPFGRLEQHERRVEDPTGHPETALRSLQNVFLRVANTYSLMVRVGCASA